MADEKRGKLLVYHKQDEATQKLLQASRKVEWDNYLKFSAVRVISSAEAADYVRHGAEELPMQWIETDKNAHLRKEKTIRLHRSLRAVWLVAETSRKLTV